MLFRMFWSFSLVLSLASSAPAMNVTDAMGRSIDVPDKVERVICSGSGCLRLLTYLEAQDLAVAVDDIESRRNRFDSRPYALANPQFKTMPIFGQFRGQDNPELILTLEPQPQVIFKTFATMGHDPVELQNKTGIPVVVLDAGNLGAKRADFYASLRLMGQIVGKKERAEDLVAYFDAAIADLARRTADIPQSGRPSAYIGGVAYKGPHGFQSTEPTYPPFLFVQARNLAREEGGAGRDLSNTDVAKEKIVVWDPDHLFLDLSTLQMGEDAGGCTNCAPIPPTRRSRPCAKGGFTECCPITGTPRISSPSWPMPISWARSSTRTALWMSIQEPRPTRSTLLSSANPSSRR